MVFWLFFLSVVTLPFSDFAGLPFLGEMQHDLSAHLMLLALGFGFAVYLSWQATMRTFGHFNLRGSDSIGTTDTSALTKLFYIYMVVAFLSLVFNLPTIVFMHAREKSGVVKYISSVLLICVGFCIAYFSFFMGRIYKWHDILVRPIAIGVVIATFFAILEGLSFSHGGAFKALQTVISSFTHSGSRGQLGMYNFYGGAFGWGDDTEGRTRSVSFEAPAFADYIGLVWPWLIFGYLNSKGARSVRYLVLSLISLVLLYSSGARTGYVFMAGNIFAFFLLRNVYLPEGRKPWFPPAAANFCLRFGALAAIAIYALFYNKMVASFLQGDIHHAGRGISNISRGAMMTAGWKMFIHNPIFGLGFGQYGFQVYKYIPSWGWMSWELKQWLVGSANVWPSSYSYFVHISAEAGLPGLILWTGTWVFLAREVYRATHAYQQATGKLLYASYPLIMGCYGILLHCIASDSLRSPIIWITLGFGFYFVMEVRRQLAMMQNSVAVPDKRPEIRAVTDANKPQGVSSSN